MKIVIAQHKGGVGKTTLATHVAGVLSGNGLDKVLLMDCDSQGDSFRFFSKRLPEKNMDIEEGMDEVDILWNPSRAKLATENTYSEYDHVVVDIDTKVQNALQVITELVPDVILIPIDQQYLSLEHLAEVLRLLSKTEGKITYPATVKIVQMGSNHDIRPVLESLPNRPRNLYYGHDLPYLPLVFNKSLRDCNYAWNDASHNYDLKTMVKGIIS
jgi:chromosome partitioning protein